MNFANEHELRAFLRICIEPGEQRDKRTPVRLAAAMPAPVLAALAEHAPHVDAIRKATEADAQRAEESRNAYAAALLSWIRDEQPTRRVRGLVAAGEEHVTSCVACTENGVISHRCPVGRRLVASFLAPSLDDEEEIPCRHESWEVTSEYAEGQQWKTWVQSRRCADCREPLPDIRRADPHFPQQREGEAAAALGHATVEETTAAYTTSPAGADEERSAVPVLPWADLLPDDEVGDVLGEIALALAHGRTPVEDESREQRHRRTLGLIDTVLAAHRDKLQGTAPAPREMTVETTAEAGGAPADVPGADALRLYTTGWVRSAGAQRVEAAVHVYLDPRLELSTDAVNEAREAIRSGLAVREQ